MKLMIIFLIVLFYVRIKYVNFDFIDLRVDELSLTVYHKLRCSVFFVSEQRHQIVTTPKYKMNIYF